MTVNGEGDVDLDAVRAAVARPAGRATERIADLGLITEVSRAVPPVRR
ncbi:hypothetical protein [Micromonospora sp. AMSO31t]|nr:hypothetical protein [Micromonospora sp. AMSO31t]